MYFKLYFRKLLRTSWTPRHGGIQVKMERKIKNVENNKLSCRSSIELNPVLYVINESELVNYLNSRRNSFCQSLVM